MHQSDPILRLREVSDLIGRSVSAINRDRKAGTFPAPIQLGPRCVGWRLSSITAWICSRDRGAPGASAFSQANTCER